MNGLKLSTNAGPGPVDIYRVPLCGILALALVCKAGVEPDAPAWYVPPIPTNAIDKTTKASIKTDRFLKCFLIIL